MDIKSESYSLKLVDGPNYLKQMPLFKKVQLYDVDNFSLKRCLLGAKTIPHGLAYKVHALNTNLFFIYFLSALCVVANL